MDGIKSVGELIKVSEESKIPLMVNMNEKGFVGGNVAIEQIREMNFSIGLFPISSMLAASQGMIEVMEALASQGTTLGVSESAHADPQYDGAVFPGGEIFALLRPITLMTIIHS